MVVRAGIDQEETESSNLAFFFIGECGSTLYVGLSGIVRNLIQKSTGWDHTFLSIFFFFFF